MKPLLAAFALALFLAGSAAAQDVRLSCLRGETLSEADLAKGVTIIVVWASWSPRSRDVVERVNPLAAQWSGRARVLTVNFQEERSAIDGFLAGKSLSVPVCLDADGSFSKKYNVANLPGLLVVRDGQVAYRGKLPENPDAVIADLLR
ncbi:MAG TPA: TlpA disulfide reductase family protein [Thermoanaerobaculia bacterium]|nr:TlpA disulfide reductase family protein [Thermoanaerobaculia bacterium]